MKIKKNVFNNFKSLEEVLEFKEAIKKRFKENSFLVYCWFAGSLCIPAFLFNLGLCAFIGDEAIRALVASEMMISGNYVVPSLTGDFYFSKPPLYNWILILFYKVFGRVDEYVSRLPTVIFSFIFTYIIYAFNRHRFNDKKYAVILAFAFLTCGRMIFYDTFLGLIDIFYSTVIYALIIGAYYLAEKGMYSKMYFYVYGLSVIGYMLKGFPTVHFLLFTIILVHVIFGEWGKLKSKGHFLSILMAAVLLSIYYLTYNNYRDATATFAPLLDQATRRTIVRFSFMDVLKHLVTYPFENLYHFFPWSILGFLVFQKDIVQKLRQNKYIWYVTLSFLLNFVVYWTSPEVYPRYILMLIPLIFTVWIYLYQNEVGKNKLIMNIISWLFKIIVIITPILIITKLNDPRLKENSSIYIAALVGVLIIVTLFYFKDQPNRPIIFVIYLLVLRIGFNALVLPVRASTGDDEYHKKEAQRIANTYGKVRIYGQSYLNHISAFYMTNITGTIVSRTRNLYESKYFIIDSTYMNDFVKIDSFPDASHGGTRWIIEGK